jgi:hypothetical protein
VTELLAGSALVVALASGVAVLVLASEVGALKRQRNLALPAVVRTERVRPLTRSSLTGEEVRLPPAEPAIMLFAMQQCGPCEELLGSVRNAEKDLRAALLVIALAPPEVARALGALAGLAPGRVIPDPTGEIARHFAVLRYPTALATTPEGVGRSQVVNRLAQLRQLLPAAALTDAVL